MFQFFNNLNFTIHSLFDFFLNPFFINLSQLATIFDEAQTFLYIIFWHKNTVNI